MGLVFRRRIGIFMWCFLLFVAVLWSNLRSTTLEATGIGFAPPVNISSLETGRLMALEVNLHDEVEADDLLASLDPTPLKEEREVLAAQMRAIEQLGQIDLATDSAKVQNARLKLGQIKGEISTDRALIAALENDKRIAQGLEAKGVESRNRVLAISNDISIAKARLQGNLAALATASIEDPTLQPEDLQPEDNDWQVTAAARTLAMMDARIKRMELNAEIGGQITMIFHEPGEVVFGGDPVVQITKTGTSEVLAYLPTPSAIGLDAGSAAWVVRGTGQVIKGALISVGSSPQPLPEQLWHSPAYPEWGVPVRIKLAKGEIGPGEHVVVRI